MIKDAEAHAAEDKSRRSEVDVRNNADSAVYQIQRQLSEAGDKIPAHEKSRIEQLLAETKKALADNASVDHLRTLTSDLNQAANVFTQSPEEKPHNNGEEPSAAASETGDVVDAEYTEK